MSGTSLPKMLSSRRPLVAETKPSGNKSDSNRKKSNESTLAAILELKCDTGMKRKQEAQKIVVH